jgi:hypothetical protein
VGERLLFGFGCTSLFPGTQFKQLGALHVSIALLRSTVDLFIESNQYLAADLSPEFQQRICVRTAARNFITTIVTIGNIEKNISTEKQFFPSTIMKLEKIKTDRFTSRGASTKSVWRKSQRRKQ